MSLFPIDSGQTSVRLVQAGAALLAAALLLVAEALTGRSSLPSTPMVRASQPKSLAVVVSSPSPTSPGVATIIDYSGDTIMARHPIGPVPVAFARGCDR